MKQLYSKLFAVFAMVSLWTFSSVDAQAQCNPRFSGTPCTGAPIQFEANSPGSANWQWDFGDGNTSQDQNPIYSYTTPGTYTVTFKSSGAVNCTETFQITIFASPEPKLTLLTPATQCFQGNEFCLRDESTHPGNHKIIKRTVLFGDGIRYDQDDPAPGEIICHTINDKRGGDFNVEIRLEDENGCITTVRYDNMIKVWPRLGISFTSDRPIGCDSTTVTILNQSEIDFSDVDEFTWDFGNGDVQTYKGDNVTESFWKGPMKYTYYTNGVFDGTLTVKAKFGCTESFTFNATATNFFFDPVILADEDSTCASDPSTKFEVEGGMPAGASFVWNFGNPPVGPPNINDRDAAPEFDSYGTGPWMASVNIINGPCNKYAYDTVFKIGPSSTIEIPFDRVPQDEKYQCVIRDSVHFPNNSSFYHADGNLLDEDVLVPWDTAFRAVIKVSYLKETILCPGDTLREPVTDYYYGNTNVNIGGVNITVNSDSLANIGGSNRNLKQGDSLLTILTGGIDSIRVSYDTNFIYKDGRGWYQYAFNYDIDTRTGDQTAIPREPAIREDDNIYRLWTLGDNYAPKCTTDVAANKNVGLNCNFTMDEKPVHWYTPWDDLYYNFQDGQFFSTPATRVVLSKNARSCNQVNVYPYKEYVVPGLLSINYGNDSFRVAAWKDALDQEKAVLFDSTVTTGTTLIPSHEDMIIFVPAGTKVVNANGNPNTFKAIDTSATWAPDFPDTTEAEGEGYFILTKGEEYTLSSGTSFDFLSDTAMRIVEPDSMDLEDYWHGPVTRAMTTHDRKYRIPAGVVVKVKKFANGTGERTEVGPKEVVIEKDEQFELLVSCDTIYNTFTYNFTDSRLIIAQPSTYRKDTVMNINGKLIDTFVQVTDTFYDFEYHRNKFYEETAQCNSITLYQKDTVHPFKCESTANATLALTPPSAEGLLIERGLMCPQPGNNPNYVLTMDMAETKPGCSQSWFEVNYDSLKGPNNWFAFNSGGVLAPPHTAPTPLPFVLPYDIVGTWGTKWVKTYRPIDLEPLEDRKNGGITLGLIIGNGIPTGGNPLPAECLDTFWYSEFFNFLQLDAEFEIIHPKQINGDGPFYICAGEKAWFKPTRANQDSISTLRWNWGDTRPGYSQSYQEEFHYWEEYPGPSSTRNDRNVDMSQKNGKWYYNYLIRSKTDPTFGTQEVKYPYTSDTVVIAIIRDWEVGVDVSAGEDALKGAFEALGIPLYRIPQDDIPFYLGDGSPQNPGCIDTTGLSKFFKFGKQRIRDSLVVKHEDGFVYRYTDASKTDSVVIEEILHFRDSSVLGYDTLITDLNTGKVYEPGDPDLNQGGLTLDSTFGVYKFKYIIPRIKPDPCDPSVRDTVYEKLRQNMFPRFQLANTVGCAATTTQYLNVGHFGDFPLVEDAVCLGNEIKIKDSIRYYYFGPPPFPLPPMYPLDAPDRWDDPARFGIKEFKYVDYDTSDGYTFQQELEMSYTYTTPGEYTIAIRTVDSVGCADTFFKTAVVTKAYPEIFNTDTVQACDNIVNFIDTTDFDDACGCENDPSAYCDRVVKRVWSYGDKTRDNQFEGHDKGDKVSHNYTTPGTYDVKLVITTELGCTDSVEQQINIPGPRPEFKFAGKPLGVDSVIICVDDSINVSNISKDPVIDPTWSLNWGDNAISSSTSRDTLGHRYTDTGTFYLYLIQTDSIEGTNQRCSKIFPDSSYLLLEQRKIKVIVLPRAKAGIEISDSIVCPDQLIDFKVTDATDTIYKRFLWNFGDGDTVTRVTKDVQHSYDDNGDSSTTYTIVMIPDYDAKPFYPKCLDTAFGTVTVINPVADFEIDSTNSPEFCFKNTSKGAVEYRWDFDREGGTGNDDPFTEMSRSINACYDYGQNIGEFNVCLIARNEAGCEDTTCKVVTNSYAEVINFYNVFTPNGDGDNDLWFIKVENVEEITVRIFNRWGEQVFETNTILPKDGTNPNRNFERTVGWDGTVNNEGKKECPEGAYFFQVEYKFLTGEMQDKKNSKTGSIELIRDTNR